MIDSQWTLYSDIGNLVDPENAISDQTKAVDPVHGRNLFKEFASQ